MNLQNETNSSYPVPNTIIYPVYCYSNFSKQIFSIGCTSQLLISLFALLTCIPIAVVLRRLLAKKKKQRLKIISFSLMFTLELLIFIYYFFIFLKLSQVIIYITNMLQAVI